MGHQNPNDAVWEAWEKLQRVLDRLVLPSEVSLALLAGDGKELTALDIPQSMRYIRHRNDYEFIGGLVNFCVSFVRISFDKIAPLFSDHADDDDDPDEKGLEDEDEPKATESTRDILSEEQSVLQVLALIVQMVQGQGRPKLPAPGWLKPEDALLLVRGMLINNTGRALVGTFVHQHERAAVEIIRLWVKHWASSESVGQETIPWTGTEKRMYDVALARFLASEAVYRSPEMRRAVRDLFEIPIRRSPTQPSLTLLLGSQERMAARFYHQDRRDELLQVLQALEDVPDTQRQALCAQLLAQEPAASLLTVLEHEGWERPSWLDVPTPGVMQDSQAQVESDWADEEETTDSDADEPSRAIFLVGRQRWLAELARRKLDFQARALAFEFLGIFFWGRSWQERLDGEPVASFYKTLMNALHSRLRAVMRAAWLVAYQQKLANLPELIGLVGCLPPQLPAQIDQRPFFEAMQERLSPKEDQDSESSAGQADGLSPTLRRLRQDLVTARSHAYAWLLALAGLVDDNERRILLAAFSQAGDEIKHIERWIEGQQPSQTEVEVLLAELKRWHPKTKITRKKYL